MPSACNGTGRETALHIQQEGLIGHGKPCVQGCRFQNAVFGVGLVRHGQNQRVQIGELIQRREREAIFMAYFPGVSQRIVYQHIDAVFLQFADHVDNPGVPQVRHVFLEREAKDAPHGPH